MHLAGGVGRGVSTVPSRGTGVCLVFIELLATENWFVVTCSGPFWFFMCITGGDLSPLELADVNGDGLRDVLLSFVMSRNGSAVGKRHVFSRLLQGHCQLGENIRAVSQVVLQRMICSEQKVTMVLAYMKTLIRKLPHINKAQSKKSEGVRAGRNF